MKDRRQRRYVGVREDTDAGQMGVAYVGILGYSGSRDSFGRKTRVTPERAKSLRAGAWVFYEPLPSGSLEPRDLFRLARKGGTVDFMRFVITGLLGGLVMLLPAMVVGVILDEVIPTGAAGLLYAGIAALVAFALIRALLHVLQGTALMRLEGRATSRVEAAFWDRLLRLPLSCLHRYSAGDLAMRGMTFQHLRDTVQGVVANAVLSVVFLSPAFLLICLYDTMLGGITAAFGLLSLIVTVILGLGQISPQDRVIPDHPHLAGRLFRSSMVLPSYASKARKGRHLRSGHGTIVNKSTRSCNAAPSKRICRHSVRHSRFLPGER